MYCNNCFSIIKHPTIKQSGTTSLTKHLNSAAYRGKKRGASTSQIDSIFVKRSKNDKSAAPVFAPETFKLQLLTAIVSINLPFYTIKNPNFRRLLSLLRPRLEVPHQKKIKAQLDRRYKEIKELRLDGLGPHTKVSIALDCWTSPNHLNFLAVTGCYIAEDWTLREVLLGFEPALFTHSGSNLANVVARLLYEFDIADRLFAVTADNASNNKTLCRELQGILHYRDIDWSPVKMRVPCLAHVIQLSVTAFLHAIAGSATNDSITTTWKEEDLDDVRGEISFSLTLKKLRKIAVAVNASPKRLELFRKLQTGGGSVILLQDVRTRWNSTYLMLCRALRLQRTVSEWLCHPDTPQQFSRLDLERIEWDRIRYLIVLLEPYYICTLSLSKTSGPSISQAWLCYNTLFEHIETQKKRLSRKREGWKRELVTALEAANAKLSEYYSATADDAGLLYNAGCVLDPGQKLEYYRGKEFGGGDWPDIYGKQFAEFYKTRYHSLEKEPVSSMNAPARANTSMAALIARNRLGKQRPVVPLSQLSSYLESATVQTDDLLEFWKGSEATLPGLAQMARDVLAIPVSGVGVERLFNTARDICHFRRHSLDASTIQKLMHLRHHNKLIAKLDDATGESEMYKELLREIDAIDEEIRERAVISDDEGEGEADST